MSKLIEAEADMLPLELWAAVPMQMEQIPLACLFIH